MLFESWAGLGRVLLVGTLAYVALVFLLRISGKRTLTKLNAFDLVVTVALGSTLATVLLSKSVALTEGVLALGLLIFLQYAIAWLSVRSPKFQTLIKAEPTLLLRRGRLLEGAMKAERITREEILAALRANGATDVSSVAAIVLETDGTLSIIPEADASMSTLDTVRRLDDAPARAAGATERALAAETQPKEDGMLHVESHGARIPALGLGTFRLDGRVARRMVGYALEIGYRHIDTAQMYGNEGEIGAAIASSGVARDDIWLTTKIWPDNFRDGALQRAAETSVRRLRTEPDLLLLHWPNPNVPLAETMRALNEAKRRGLARHIGISNFTVALIQEALALTEEPLIVDQVEYQPYLSQDAVLEELRANGMALIAYSPLAQGRVFGDQTLARIGERHGKNPGQVTLRWLLQQDGVTAIPRSSREAHAKANFEIFDFTLSDAEMAEISALARPGGRQIDPAGMAPRWD